MLLVPATIFAQQTRSRCHHGAAGRLGLRQLPYKFQRGSGLSVYRNKRQRLGLRHDGGPAKRATHSLEELSMRAINHQGAIFDMLKPVRLRLWGRSQHCDPAADVENKWYDFSMSLGMTSTISTTNVLANPLNPANQVVNHQPVAAHDGHQPGHAGLRCGDRSRVTPAFSRRFQSRQQSGTLLDDVPRRQ